MAKDEKNLDKEAPPLATDAVVDGWFMEYFPNSPIARSDECWQLLHRAVTNLKQRLKGENHG